MCFSENQLACEQVMLYASKEKLNYFLLLHILSHTLWKKQVNEICFFHVSKIFFSCVGTCAIFSFEVSNTALCLWEAAFYACSWVKMIVSRLNVVTALLKPWQVSSPNRGLTVIIQSKYEVLKGWHSRNRVFLKNWDLIWHWETGNSWLHLFILPK
jgi:hypothetical protein